MKKGINNNSLEKTKLMRTYSLEKVGLHKPYLDKEADQMKENYKEIN
jgi:hypothetical protein